MILLLIALFILLSMYGFITLKSKTYSQKQLNNIGLVYLFILGSIVFFILETYESKNLTNNFFFELIILLTTFIILILILIKYILSESQSQSNQKALDDLKMYTDNLEKIYDDMRVFKHDYMNILSTLSYYIEEENIDELKKYFSENIVPLSSQMHNNNHKIGLLKNIKDEDIKGLIAIKLIQAQEKGIDVFVDITQEVSFSDIDKLNLCKILGILVDNAIEAAERTQGKRFEFAIITEENFISLIIRNSIENQKINLQKIFKKGYSTKGENRGLGLYIVQSILTEENKISLDTQAENNIFTQKITFKE
ncbi:MAG: sensor histidine kinase [Sarcina sp.]